MSYLGDRRSGRRWICTALLVSTLLFVILFAGISAQNAASRGTGAAGANAPAASCPDPIKIMPLGDSITRGYGYGFGKIGGETKPEFIGYRQWLYEDLKDAGYNVDFVGHCKDPGPLENNRKYGCGGDGILTEDIPGFDGEHEGHGGKTTRWFLQDKNDKYPPENGLPSRLESYLSDLAPDIILLHIGMNDLTGDRSAVEIGDDIERMLDIIYEKNPDAVVILAKVIKCYWNDTCIETRDSLNEKIGELANNYCNSGKCVLRLVDMASAVEYPSHYYDCKYHDCKGREVDGRHPNKDGYEKMFEVWKKELDEYLPSYCAPPQGEWVDMGNVSGSGLADEPALALGTNGIPIIAWSDYSGGDQEIYVKEWKNSAWAPKGSGSAAGGGISISDNDSIRVAITVDGGGSPIVVWEERKELGSEIYVKQWKNGAWKEMGENSASEGGISDSGDLFPGAATRPAVAYGQDGPIVAWHNYAEYEGNEAYQIFVKRWENGTWKEMGAGSAGNGGISNSLFGAFTPSVAVYGEEVFVAWSDSLEMNSDDLFTNNIYLRRWDGDSWEEMNGSFSGHGISKTEGESYRPSLAISPDGRPVVAWEDNTKGNFEIYLKEWDGDSWEAMNGSTSGGGVSGTAMPSKWPSLGIGSNGLPVVAWQEARTDDIEVYGKRWDGSSWVEMNGSASGGGISNYGVVASKPSLAVDDHDAPIITWDAGIAGDYDVFARRWQAAEPPPLPTPTPPPAAVPSLAIDHTSGAPGSFFTLSGSGFPAGEEAAVSANGRDLGSVGVSSEGGFEFFLSTTGADEGYYLITASVNPNAIAQFEISVAEPEWLQGGSGPILEVPVGIAFTDRLFLPVNLR